MKIHLLRKHVQNEHMIEIHCLKGQTMKPAFA